MKQHSELTPCHFPSSTSDSTLADQPATQYVELPEDAPKLLAQCLVACQQDSSSILQVAWAVLLRQFVDSEVITFGFATDSEENVTPQSSNRDSRKMQCLFCSLVLSSVITLSDTLRNLHKSPIGVFTESSNTLPSLQTIFNTAVRVEKGASHDSFDLHQISKILAKCDLLLVANLQHNQWYLQYNESRIPTSHAQRLGNNFIQILKSIAAGPSQKLEDLTLISEADLNQVWSWNEAVPELFDCCVHELFERQLDRHAGDIAVASWDGDVTYQQLDDLATRLAYHLVANGVRPGHSVPFCFHKSIIAVAVILAILKAGGACVPLDPSYPLSRLQKIVDIADAGVVLVDAELEEVCQLPRQTTILVSRAFIESLPIRIGRPCSDVGSSDPAFIAFTSGSTGSPKGIIQEHGGVCTSVRDHGARMGLSAASRVFQFAAYVFDISLSDLFATFLHGGCVCVPSEYERRNDIQGAINRTKANHACLTPTVARQIHPSEVPSLKCLALAGEPPTVQLFETWASKVHLMNVWGVTEGTIYNSCTGKLEAGSSTSNIGRAVGCVCWITDRHNPNKLAPIGAVGELLVEGHTLARGYLKDPQKTEEAFIQGLSWLDGKSRRGRGRLYRTGDLVRYNNDGTILYIRRKDTQVKLRGQRIEMSEVEFHLRRHLPAHLHVLAGLINPSGAPTDQQTLLVAFVCLGDEFRGNEETLRPVEDITRLLLAKYTAGLYDRLSEVLPAVMVPTVYMPLKNVPLTVSGKVDKQKLRALGSGFSMEELAAMSSAGAEKRMPQTPQELQIAELWSSTLGLSKNVIGLDDNFFRMGGDSVSAMRLVTAARRSGLQLTVESIFRNPKLRKMVLVSQNRCPANTRKLSAFSLLSSSPKKLLDVRLEVAKQSGLSSNLIQDIYPVTPLQQGLVVQATKNPDAYIVRSVIELPRSVDLKRFQDAWSKVVAANDLLRTRFAETSEHTMVQAVFDERLTWLSDNDLTAYLRKDRQLPMNIGSPTTRYALISESAAGVEQRFFVWTAHHAVFDGWSYPLIQSQVEKAYYGKEFDLPTPFVYFVDHLSAMNQSKAREFWRTQLEGFSGMDFPPSPSPAYRPVLKNSDIRLIQFRRVSDSPFTTSALLRAAWSILLARYASATDTHNDVVFGMTLAGRNVPVEGIESMTGPTIATIPMRVQFDRGERVVDFLQRIQDQSTAMIPFEHLGIQNIQRLSEDARTACNFKTLMVVHPRNGGQKKAGLFSRDMAAQDAAYLDAYSMVLECTMHEGHLGVRLMYDEKVVEKDQSHRILCQFEHVLAQIVVEDDASTISTISTISNDDQRTLEVWNNNILPPKNSCIHSLFQRVAWQTPEATAIDAWDGSLTYHQLDFFSTSLATHLQDLGVRPETKVILCFSKSMWAVVAILGVMKAGGCIIPLDPVMPKARLSRILTAVAADVVITQSGFADIFKDQHSVLLVDWRPKTHDTAQTNIPNLFLSNIQPCNTVYILFTSGSTGVPKGVVVEHGSLSAEVLAQIDILGVSATTRWFQFASFTFDIAFSEILNPLLRGGCLCIASEHDRLNKLAEAVNKFRATHLFLTPTVVSRLKPSEVPNLRVLQLGGEPMTKEIVKTWAPAVSLYNFYGPTECTISCLSTNQVSLNDNPNNIGRALASRAWIVDTFDHNLLAPIGAVGELVIEGPIVAREYFADPKQSSTVFLYQASWLPSPISGTTTRLYKTGDLVRYTSNGMISYVGRKDEQVKLRGLRIELGEVEYQLRMAMPGIKGVAAEIFQPADDEEHSILVAFLCTADLKDSATQEALKQSDLGGLIRPTNPQFQSQTATAKIALAKELPPYMIPSLFLPVQEIPLLASGKTDRRKLKAAARSLSKPQRREYLMEEKCVALPETEPEKVLWEVWSQVLGLSANDFGVCESFTSLGGDSIDAMQAVSKCRFRGISVTVSAILLCRSIRELCGQVQISTAPRKHSTESKVEKVHVSFALSPIQDLFFAMAPHGENHYNQSYTWKINQKILSSSVKQAVTALVERHPMLRARFNRQSDGTWRQFTTDDAVGSFCYQFRSLEGTQAAEPICLTMQNSLDIEKGPLLSVALFSRKGEHHTLYFVAHHLIVDFVSWNIISEELERLLSNQANIPPPLTFQAWCEAQANYIQDMPSQQSELPYEVQPTSFTYWKMDQKANSNQNLVERDFCLDETTTALLAGRSNGMMRTQTVDILLGNLFYTFHSVFSDRPLPAVFEEHNGRESWDSSFDASGTVGWFTTLHPIQPQICSADSIVQVVRRVKDARHKVPLNGLGWFARQRLVEKQSGPPLIEMSFNYRGSSRSTGSFDDALLSSSRSLLSNSSNNSLSMPRLALIEIEAGIQGKKLNISVSYNSQMSGIPLLDLWIDKYAQALKESINFLAEGPPMLTLSDFPSLAINYETLDRIEQKILPAVGITSNNLEDIYPCAPIQEGMMLTQMEGNASYMTTSVWEVLGSSIDPELTALSIGAAWERVVSRHPALRTTFTECEHSNGSFVQIVYKRSMIRLVHLDHFITDVPSLLNSSEGEDLNRKRPLHKLSIGRNRHGTIYCVLDISHLICDGVSISNIFRDLAKACQAGLPTAQGSPFRSFIKNLQTSSEASKIEYWTGYLAGVTACNFPVRAFNQRTQRNFVELDCSGLPSLTGFCKAHELTLASIVQVAWALALQAFIGTDDVCFGFATAGRDAAIAEIDTAVGVFIGLLVTRIQLAGSKPVLKLLKDTQTNTMKSLDHQHFSLGAVQHALEIKERPFFNTMMTVRKEIKVDQQSSVVTFCEVAAADCTEYDLTVSIEPRQDTARIVLEFWPERIQAEQVAHVAGTFHHIFESILLEPNQCVSDIDLLSHRQLSQIWTWNKSLAPRIEMCVHQIFEDWARKQPNSQAICAWDGSLTYHELDTASTALSIKLHDLGVGSEAVVPLCFDKSMWTAISILGVLKAGGAFVLLDPSVPISRLELIIQTVEASVIVCSEERSGMCANLAKTLFVVSADLLTTPIQQSLKPAEVHVTPSDALYVVFTSGTTGRPKGSVMEHGRYCSGAVRHAEAHFFTRTSRVLQFSSYSFDVSIQDMLTTLLVGGCICIPSDFDRMNDVPGAVSRLQANTAHFTPSLLQLIKPDDVPGLRTLVVSGEAMTVRDVATWADRVKLVNSYGPSECCITSAVRPMESSTSDPMNIGRPICGAAWITSPSDHDKLMPIGAVGELLIEGPHLSRGYMNEPEKTEAAFIEFPSWLRRLDHGEFSDTGRLPHLRLYKTGDLVRYSMDGTLTFVGRKDTQVKLRGQRIELGEVEHHLWQCIQGAADVVAELVDTGGEGGIKKLVAFILNQKPHEGSLRTCDDLFVEQSSEFGTLITNADSELSKTLPAFMVPSAYIEVKAMPMTASGKRDRKKLRNLASTFLCESLDDYRAKKSSRNVPSTVMERYLQKAWAATLEVRTTEISSEDNFFRLGGDSIAAMRLVPYLRSKNILLSVAQVFRNAKLQDMAKVALLVEEQITTASEIQPLSLLKFAGEEHNVRSSVAQLCDFEEQEIEDILPCTPLQEGLMALSIKQPGAYVSRTIRELRNGVDIDKFRAIWERVMETNTILRTVIVVSERFGMLQVVVKSCPEWQFATSMDAYIGQDQGAPITLGGNLTRYAIVNDLANKKNYFVWTTHHAAYDGWSIALLLSQLEECSKGVILPMSPSFNQFVRYVAAIDPDKASAFWKAQCQGMRTMAFPSLPSPAYQPSANAQTRQQLNFSRQGNPRFTLPTIIRAAWAILVAQYSPSNDVVFGSILTGRSAPVVHIAKITGPTITTVPIFTRVRPDQPLPDFLQELQDQAVEMMSYEQTGLHNIRRISEELRSACDFQTLLITQPEQPAGTAKSLFVDDGIVEDTSHLNTYPITLTCTYSAKALLVRCSFDSKVIEERQMARMISQLCHVINQICCVPDVTVGSIDLLTVSDRREIVGWNRHIPETVSMCIHDQIAQRITEIPDAHAVCSWDGSLSYAQLDQYSTQVALRLSHYVFGPDVIVPICSEKSVWVIVCILGVLKAGAGFLLLDPSLPELRLQTIISEVRASVCFCSLQAGGKVAKFVEKIITVSPGHFNIADAERGARALTVTNPQSIAYVVFTSGSTGKPKGSMIEHQAYVSGAMEHIKALNIDKTTRLLQFASFSFDVSIQDIVSTLMAGGCVCLPNDEARHNDIVGEINRLKVNTIHLTPSFVRLLDPQSIPLVRTVILGGESLRKSDIETWSNKTKLISSYGPSECCVTSMVHQKIPTDSLSSSSNIGFAVGANSWVVDPTDCSRLSPIGIIGELCLEGPILARGYLGDSQQTANQFVSDLERFKNAPDIKVGRLYRTGDLVKYASDGSVTFVGRKDTQVKLRGQRLELGEVEHQLTRHLPSMNDVVADVVMPRDNDSQAVLVAFISTKDFHHSDLEDIAENPCQTVRELAPSLRTTIFEASHSLEEVLPAYMIPTFWLPIRAMLFTPTGKKDRKTLHKIASGMSLKQLGAFVVDEAPKKAPSDSLQQRLQQIWSDVLNVPTANIGTNDSFFRHGGDSISAMQVVARARAMKIGIAMSAVLRLRTIAELAKTAEFLTEGELVDETTVNISFALSPIQRTFFDLAPYGENHYNQSFTLRLDANIAERRIEDALRTIVSRHSMLRARFGLDEKDEWSQRITEYSPTSLSYRKYNLSNIKEVKPLAIAVQKSLDIRSGPLISAASFVMQEKSHQILFLVIHHLVVDFVSWRIILGELDELLKRKNLEANPALSFQTWCKLQEKNARDLPSSAKTLPFLLKESDQAYWWVSGPQNCHRDVVYEDFKLDTKTTSLLLDQANEAMRTRPLDIMIASFLFSFQSVFVDREAPILHVEGHGREPWDSSMDLSSTVGWFTTLTPFQVFCGPEADVCDVVREIKDIRSQIPGNGRPYFADQLLNHKQGTNANGDQTIEIVLNYAGVYQQLERTGSMVQPHADALPGEYNVEGSMPRRALLEIVAEVRGGEFCVSVFFSKYMRHEKLIKQWVRQSNQVLQNCVEQLAKSAVRLTLSDYPLLHGSYRSIDHLQQILFIDMKLSLDEIEDIYPCSKMQQGIMLSKAQNVASYDTSTTWSVRSRSGHNPDPVRLGTAWRKVVERHSALRTIFLDSISDDGAFIQVVLKHVNPKITYLKSSDNHPERLLEMENVQLAREEPCHQLVILISEDQKMYCKLHISHLISDGASLSVLFRDFTACYGEEVLEEPLQYGDFISYLDKQQPQTHLQYWKDVLDGVSPCFIPTQAQYDRYDLEVTHIDLEVFRGVKDFCDHHEVTIATLCQLAWAIVLRLYTGMEDVSFGFAASGRHIPLDRINDSVGLFMSVLISRLCMREDLPFTVLLKQIQTNTVSAIDHQHFSLAELHHVLQLDGHSLFNTMLTVFRESVKSASNQQTIQFENIGGADETEYDLTLYVAIEDDEIKASLQSWGSRLPKVEAMQIAKTFADVLSRIMDEPEKNMAASDFVSRQDREQMETINAYLPKEVEVCLHELVHREALRTPKAVAVSAWDGELTYFQLDQLSTRLAKHLASLGVTLEVMVPLCFDKSLWFVVAMLGVMKAGGACVPLDRSTPSMRLSVILKEVGATVLITDSSNSYKFRNKGLHIVEDIEKVLSKIPLVRADPRLASTPNSAALVSFTSGSTGTPKGIVVNHKSLSTSVIALTKHTSVARDSRVLQFAAHTFDVHVGDIFSALICGACVCIPSESDRISNLAKSMTTLRATHACLTPTVANQLHPDAVPHLRVLTLGGEPMNKNLVRTWGEKVRLNQIYGVTECTIWCAFNADFSDERNDVTNIGHGMASVCWIVDAANPRKLVPTGAVGEIVIEGPLLARGYLNAPERTAEMFVKDLPWLGSIRKGLATRVYRTGDLGKYNSDGSIIFLGRRDTQVKVRGQRLELTDIEECVGQCLDQPAEVTAEVIVPSDQNGRQLLAAFIRLPGEEDDQTVNQTNGDGNRRVNGHTGGCVNEHTNGRNSYWNPGPHFDALVKNVCQRLPQLLPPYMIPAIFLPIRRMPLTASGKTDRKQLREITGAIPLKALSDLSRPDRRDESPYNEMEKTLQSIWAEVLRVAPTGILRDDSFFRVGGDSVLAMRLTAAARMQGIVISVADVFSRPTLSAMSEAARPVHSRDRVEHQRFSSFRPTNTNHPTLDFIFSQLPFDRNDIEDIFEGTNFQSDAVTAGMMRHRGWMNFYTFDFDRLLETEQLGHACQRLVAHHQILRTIFVAGKRKFWQVVLKDVQADIRTFDLQPDIESQTKDIIQVDKELELHMGQGLVRFFLLCSPQGTRRLILRLSHAQYDGLCLPRIYSDLGAGFAEARLPPVVPFSSFAQKIAQMDTQPAEQYWRALLSGTKMTNFRLHPTPAHKHPFDMTISRETRLTPLSKDDITLSTIVKTAWALLLSEISSQRDVVFGYLNSGRNLDLEGIDRIVGPCIDMIPIRAKLQPGERISQLLQHIQAQHVATMPFESLGFKRIVERCTTWPRWTRLSSVVQIQNLDNDLVGARHFADTRCRVGAILLPHDIADIYVHADPQLDSTLSVQLSFAEATIPRAIGEELAIRLCDTMEYIAANPDKNLLSALAKVRGQRKIAIPFSTVPNGKHSKQQEHLLLLHPSSQSSQSSTEKLSAVRARVNQTWQDVLFESAHAPENTTNNGSRDASSINTALDEVLNQCDTDYEDTPFYEIYGNLVAAAQMATIYRRAGYEVSIEDVLEKPTRAEQVEMLMLLEAEGRRRGVDGNCDTMDR